MLSTNYDSDWFFFYPVQGLTILPPHAFNTFDVKTLDGNFFLTLEINSLNNLTIQQLNSDFHAVASVQVASASSLLRECDTKQLTAVYFLNHALETMQPVYEIVCCTVNHILLPLSRPGTGDVPCPLTRRSEQSPPN